MAAKKPTHECNTRLIADTPQEGIVYSKSRHDLVGVEDVYPRLPNLEALYPPHFPYLSHFQDQSWMEPIPSPSHCKKKYLAGLIADNDEWGVLTAFLSRRAACGNKLNSLVIVDSSDIASGIVEDIRSLAGEFRTLLPQRVRNIGLSPCSLLPPSTLRGDTYGRHLTHSFPAHCVG